MEYLYYAFAIFLGVLLWSAVDRPRWLSWKREYFFKREQDRLTRRLSE